MPALWLSMRSMAKWVLPVLVGPRIARTFIAETFIAETLAAAREAPCEFMPKAPAFTARVKISDRADPRRGPPARLHKGIGGADSTKRVAARTKGPSIAILARLFHFQDERRFRPTRNQWVDTEDARRGGSAPLSPRTLRERIAPESLTSTESVFVRAIYRRSRAATRQEFESGVSRRGKRHGLKTPVLSMLLYEGLMKARRRIGALPSRRETQLRGLDDRGSRHGHQRDAIGHDHRQMGNGASQIFMSLLLAMNWVALASGLCPAIGI